MKISFDVNALKTNQQKNDFFHIKKILFGIIYPRVLKNKKK